MAKIQDYNAGREDCLPMPLTDLYIKRSEFEVFGNIFDNPELLEVE